MFFKHALEHGTFTWNTDGGWTYKAAQAGEFVYYLTYYAKPTANGHNHISLSLIHIYSSLKTQIEKLSKGLSKLSVEKEGVPGLG